MKCTMARLLCLIAISVPAESISALEKVVQMLDGMKENGLKEKQEEAVQYATYKQWCETELATKKEELTTTEDEIELLQADISTAESNVAELTEKVTALDASIAKWTTEEDNATKARAAEVATYRATHKDYTQSIQAIMSATHELKSKATGSAAQKKAMMLLAGLPKMPEEASKKMTAFLSMYHSDELVQAPEAAAYDFSGSAIVDMLEKLRIRFQDERGELEKVEMNQETGRKDDRHSLLDKQEKLMRMLKADEDRQEQEEPGGVSPTVKSKKMEVKDQAALAGSPHKSVGGA